jgi:hypothetical protein
MFRNREIAQQGKLQGRDGWFRLRSRIVVYNQRAVSGDLPRDHGADLEPNEPLRSPVEAKAINRGLVCADCECTRALNGVAHDVMRLRQRLEYENREMINLRNYLIPIPALALLLLGFMPSLSAATPQDIGPGCTTAFYIDPLCKPCGVGMKSSGQYPVNPPGSLGEPAYYTVGDMPDADPRDPTICTTAQWQAKWGTGNTGMVSFLQEEKGFTNTSRIFYVSQSGNDASGVVNDPAHPYRTLAPILAQLEDMQGGVIIIGGGNWTDLDFNPCAYSHGNPCWNLSGSPGHPVYVMNYPGEAVVTDIPFTSVTYKPFPHVCCVTLDGLEFIDPQYGLGDAISTADTTDFTIKNSEFAGWHQIIFSSHTVNALVEHSVFHDMMYHAIYYSFNTGISQGPGDFNFTLDQAKWVGGTSQGASYHGEIIGNVIYGNGDSGYEPIHINADMDYPVVEGNIVSYSGGTGIGLQTGVYHAFVADNVLFDNGRDCITLFLYDHGDPTVASTLRWNTIENNTCYVGRPTDSIRDANPEGGIVLDDGTDTPGHYIKDTTIENNVIVTYDNGVTTDQFPLKFQRNSYPETDTIKGNLFWSTGPMTGRVMVIASDASPNGGAGTYDLAQFQAFSPNFSGNVYADPEFKDASVAYTLTPGAFNFSVPPTSPAASIGANLSEMLTPPSPPLLPIDPEAILPNPPSNPTVR